MKLLIVEDELKVGDYLKQGLTEAGFVVDLVRDGNDGVHAALEEDYDLVVLDVMLPGLDGWQVLQAIRRAGRQMPVLFLTARDPVDERVKGLELGADDYLVKPFAFSELLARVRTLLRRGRVAAATVLRSPTWSSTCCAAARSRQARIDLTAKEFALLRAPAFAAGEVLAAIAHRLPGLGHELRQRHQRRSMCGPPAARQGRRSASSRSSFIPSGYGLRPRGHAGSPTATASITLRLTFFFAVASTAVLAAVGYTGGAAVEGHFVELDRPSSTES